ncbi:lytic polysaccharide monooxygenase [Simiduia agarivorans]|uniref:Chitin-binding domain-containing protein n=1 Tax=Simiduia agarivorans (strain DSM 21679 / JCM 13881 / BCRC 17597 / SA1) TaxID=1117647 RepID=K4KTK3_SIMAS|nr:lytic polysaccharide monooxygenase [Simiduia agarivorans]AFU97292.1 chitin-binding domain-containing protein [Simiduia agarivorans SA1 = DSM 21679]
MAITNISHAHFLTAPALVMALTGLLASQQATSHGYVEYPKARQQFCVDDGGYWWPADGSGIPNAACRAAFQVSGATPLTQHHEFSANVVDYNNAAAVRQTVKDGNLCGAGDASKAGMSLAHTDWQRTQVSGQIDLLFHASTPHNPSFWEVYVTKPGFNPATQTLAWDHLELVATHGNLPVVNMNGHKMYKVPVNLPAGRDGDAILFTRWQRADEAGEGFYNCSDIRFSGTTPPPSWISAGYFVKSTDVAQPGDEVWFRVFDANGQEQVFETLAISSANSDQGVWAEALAGRVNQRYSDVQVGMQQANGQIVFDSQNRVANEIWLQNSSASARVDIKHNQTPGCSQTDPNAGNYPAWEAHHVYTAGSVVAHQQLVWKAKWWNSGSEPAQTNDTWDLLSDIPHVWISGKAYQAGAEVDHAGRQWRANWWTQSEPGTSSDWTEIGPASCL